MKGTLKFIDKGSGDWGFIVPVNGGSDVFFRMADFAQSRPTAADEGIEIEFDIATQQERQGKPRAVNLRLLQNPAPIALVVDEGKDRRRPDTRGIFFDSLYLPEPHYDYVCWLDVMGTANQMLRSLPISANFIYKLQCAVLEAGEEIGLGRAGVRLYPVVDGIYITSPRRMPLEKLVNQALCRIALTFLNEEKPFHQFLVRGAVSFGPVYHGCDLPPEASYTLSNHNVIRDSMLMGLPMAQAYQEEREAPPFGIAVHASARAFAPDADRPFRFVWLNWFDYCDPKVDSLRLLEKLRKYFSWQLDHSTVTGYQEDRIRRHLRLATEYFTLAMPDRKEEFTPEI